MQLGAYYSGSSNFILPCVAAHSTDPKSPSTFAVTSKNQVDNRTLFSLSPPLVAGGFCQKRGEMVLDTPRRLFDFLVSMSLAAFTWLVQFTTSTVCALFFLNTLFFRFLNFLLFTAGFSKLIWVIRSAFVTFPQLCSRFTALNTWYHLL